jgi:hypothetical protein
VFTQTIVKGFIILGCDNIEYAKAMSPLPISPCDKDSDDFLTPINKIIFPVHNDRFKKVYSIGEDALDIFECLVFSNRYYGVQLSEMVSLSSCASTFQRVRSHMGSDLANKVGEEDF